MKRVLVVVDEPAIRDSMTMLLEDAYMVSTAANGEEALRVLGAGGDFDAVVLDLMMPVMDGEAVLRELAARGASAPSTGCASPSTPTNSRTSWPARRSATRAAAARAARAA